MIDKKKFEEYVSIQKSGVTNMFDVPTVISLSGGTLDKADCLDIMKNYSKYKKGDFEVVEMIEIKIKAKEDVINKIHDFIDSNGLVAMVIE